MRRVVVTGMGIVSSLGSTLEDVWFSLVSGKSGISINDSYVQNNLRCHVSGKVSADRSLIDRKYARFMGDAGVYACLSTSDAIKSANLNDELVSHERTGCVIGSGGASSEDIVEAYAILKERGVRKIGPYRVPKTMASTASACVSSYFGIKGLNYSISSACATSAHSIGHAFEQIQFGKQDIIFAGGAEAEHISQSCMFDAMGAFSTSFNSCPDKASRPYDINRDGFVISGGGGVLVLEELGHALARGAHIYAEIIGYGTASDGLDMVSPSGDGAFRSMKMALEGFEGQVDYINTHGTSTQAGDIVEIDAAKKVFGDNLPAFSSTKALSGHSLGAAGVHEAIYSILMIQNRTLIASNNIEELDSSLLHSPILLENKVNQPVDVVMSNSFGFGGANATLIFKRY